VVSPKPLKTRVQKFPHFAEKFENRLLSRWEKLVRGGTKDELGKPLIIAVQRVGVRVAADKAASLEVKILRRQLPDSDG
jgi:hypothetical protein